MKQELQDKLFDKYPKIFGQRDLPPQRTAMCFGLQIPDGWYSIIDNLCRGIQRYVDEKGIAQVEAAQVKEKWGGLRFYVDNGTEAIHSMIASAESLSLLVCSNCGCREPISFNRQKKVCKECAEMLDKFI